MGGEPSLGGIHHFLVEHPFLRVFVWEHRRAEGFPDSVRITVRFTSLVHGSGSVTKLRDGRVYLITRQYNLF